MSFVLQNSETSTIDRLYEVALQPLSIQYHYLDHLKIM